jgi:tRNA (guanine-N7-)-methyltransferase
MEETAGQREARALREQRIERCQHIITDFAGPANELTLEIGCGHGHWLVGFAQEHPDRLCVGIDLISKRIARANAKVAKRELANVLFLKVEMTEFLEALPRGLLLREVFFLFPDPWPKKRHFKRRMIQPDHLNRIAKKMRQGGALYFRTDHPGYFAWSAAIIAEHPRWHRDYSAPWPSEHATFFQDLLPEYRSLVAERVGD